MTNREKTYDLIMNSLSEDVPDLTEEEKRQLEEVMRKAKEFDDEEENKIRKPVEGQLFKYTNVVKGWQYRWFVLTPELGMLEYYMMDETKKNKPRGGLHLAGAVIAPSDEDDLSFTVNAICGEVYKLKAADAKERQFWVNRLRTTAEQHSDAPSEMPLVVSKIHCSNGSSQRDLTITNHQTPEHQTTKSNQPPSKKKSNLSQQISNSEVSLPGEDVTAVIDSLAAIKEWLDQAILGQRGLARLIEKLPMDGNNLRCSDTALLLLKATSKAAVQSLEECYLILRERQLAITHPKGLPPGATIEWVDTKSGILRSE